VTIYSTNPKMDTSGIQGVPVKKERAHEQGSNRVFVSALVAQGEGQPLTGGWFYLQALQRQAQGESARKTDAPTRPEALRVSVKNVRKWLG